MCEFVEREYFPRLKKKPSTINGYKGIWKRYFAARCADAWLGQVRTVTVTDWLADISEEHGLSRTTLRQIKHFLSGVYKRAKARGFFDGVNPVEDAGIPDDAPEPEETGAYSLQDVFAFLRVLPEPGTTICAAQRSRECGRATFAGDGKITSRPMTRIRSAFCA